MRIAAIVLIVAGTLGLVYGGFRYTTNAQRTSIGPIGITIQEQQNVPVPVWAAVGAIVAGSLLLLTGRRTRSS